MQIEVKRARRRQRAASLAGVHAIRSVLRKEVEEKSNFAILLLVDVMIMLVKLRNDYLVFRALLLRQGCREFVSGEPH